MNAIQPSLSLFDPPAALARQEAGMAQVAANAAPFGQQVEALVRTFPAGHLCTGEAIRLACLQQGITPHHPNAWGAAIARCVRAGLLQETGRFPRMACPSSHARRNPEYVRA